MTKKHVQTCPIAGLILSIFIPVVEISLAEFAESGGNTDRLD
ncbi:MAG: hypothetical protein ACI87W_003588, partial [Halieaceae bacterium]